MIVIVDLHAHYAMHLVPEVPGTVELAATARGRRRLRDLIESVERSPLHGGLLAGLRSYYTNGA